eukprot:GHVT01079865.1.p1 GENE.GHVT01079865.1~~GHVT01079865.1.p1  ORF type:complete len:261 (-),score=22.70 GHVT01079865.1:12-794(-)
MTSSLSPAQPTVLPTGSPAAKTCQMTAPLDKPTGSRSPVFQRTNRLKVSAAKTGPPPKKPKKSEKSGRTATKGAKSKYKVPSFVGLSIGSLLFVIGGTIILTTQLLANSKKVAAPFTHPETSLRPQLTPAESSGPSTKPESDYSTKPQSDYSPKPQPRKEPEPPSGELPKPQLGEIPEPQSAESSKPPSGKSPEPQSGKSSKSQSAKSPEPQPPKKAKPVADPLLDGKPRDVCEWLKQRGRALMINSSRVCLSRLRRYSA